MRTTRAFVITAVLLLPVIAHGALYLGEWDGESDTWLARYTL